MRVDSDSVQPLARKQDLVVIELDHEMLIYDLRSASAHCLSHTAALIWKNCNGQTSITRLGLMLQAELKIAEGEHLVWSALSQLARRELLERVARDRPSQESPAVR